MEKVNVLLYDMSTGNSMVIKTTEEFYKVLKALKNEGFLFEEVNVELINENSIIEA